MARFDALILIRGAGALGSGVAYRLVKAGFPVVMTELANPVMIRGTVSYGACVYYHAVIIEGIIARHAENEQVQDFLARGLIPVLAAPGHEAIAALSPTVVIDARDEHVNGDTTIHDAPLVIGLGPSFTAGVDCHAVIETQRGHNLGRVLWRGSAIAPDAEEIGVVRSPVEGLTTQIAVIGEVIRAGTPIMRVDDTLIYAPIDGVLCGLIDIDIHVNTGNKLAFIDPHMQRKDCFTISDKSLAIGGGVVEAVLSAPQFAKDSLDHFDELVLANRASQGSDGGAA